MKKHPLLGMGTWGMGGKFERDESNIEQSIAVLKEGLALGMSVIDVAELYGEGLTEEIVGEAISDTPRDEVYVISKVDREHLAYDDVLRAAQGSLARLNTSYLDLYLVHKLPDPEFPFEKTMQAMEELVDRGLVKAVGVSNFSVEQVREAQRYLAHTKLGAVEDEYNLLNQNAAHDLIPYCQAQGIEFIAFRPLAKGLLATERDQTLAELAEKYEKTPRQIALNWIISQGITAIPATLSPEHLRENAGALGWNLSPQDLEQLKTVS